MRTKRRRHVCVLLPDKQHLDCDVRVRARGQDVLDSVLRQLGVRDLQVFGLAVLRDNEYLFLDLDKKLSKYFGKRWERESLMVPFILFLMVQFYVENGFLILSSNIQQLYYTEMRQKVLRSQSRHQEALFFQLAASALQAEVGDEEQREESQGRKSRDYFLPEDYFPSWLIKRRGRDYLLQHGPALHAELRGVSRTEAIMTFIKDTSSLQDIAVTFYRMKQKQSDLRSLILLGVLGTGVRIYQEVEGKQCAIFDFSWMDIDRFTFQGSRFEITAVGSLCLPKLVYHTHSAFHAKHILKHLSETHRLHINTRSAVSYFQQLEDMQAAARLYKEAYICDITYLRERLRCHNFTSSISDCSADVETTPARAEEEEENEEEELWDEEPEEVFVDNPDEVSWLVELLYGVSVDGPLVLPSTSWAAVTMEMKQVLWRRAFEGASVD